jgi:hypothetical protein
VLLPDEAMPYSKKEEYTNWTSSDTYLAGMRVWNLPMSPRRIHFRMIEDDCRASRRSQYSPGFCHTLSYEPI